MIWQILPNNNERYYSNFSTTFREVNTPWYVLWLSSKVQKSKDYEGDQTDAPARPLLCPAHGRQYPWKTQRRNSGDPNPGTKLGEQQPAGRHLIHFLPLQLQVLLFFQLHPGYLVRVFLNRLDWKNCSWFLTPHSLWICSCSVEGDWLVSGVVGGQSFAAAKMSSRYGADSGRAASGDAELHWLPYRYSEFHCSPGCPRKQCFGWSGVALTHIRLIFLRNEYSLIQWCVSRVLSACVYSTSLAIRTENILYLSLTSLAGCYLL
jgi:hypothetical protein